jgi:hypothetical protein
MRRVIEMTKKEFLTALLIMMTVLTLYGCKHSQSAAFESYESENSNLTGHQAEQSTFSDDVAHAYLSFTDVPEMPSGHPEPYIYSNLDELLADVALVKFDEANRFPNRSGDLYGVADRNLNMLRELFMPRRMPWDAVPVEIFYFPHGYIGFHYFNRTQFVWLRNIPTDDLKSIPIREHGHIGWVQHGQRFSAYFNPLDFTEHELYDFAYAQPVIAWQLQGNAVSVSVQGVENVRISDEFDYEIVLGPEATPRAGVFRIGNIHHGTWLNHRTLYSIDGENRRVVGYRWRVNEELDRWQYVLEPGTYIFRFENTNNGEVGLLIRHFVDHEIISEVDLSEELIGHDTDDFTIKVTPTDNYFGELPTIPNINTASAWAQDGISRAFGLNLIPRTLRNNYTEAITRAEIAAIAVTLYENQRGTIIGGGAFHDTDDRNVEKAAYIDVVRGVGQGYFAPDELLTREQAAVMLVRLMEALEQPLSMSTSTFSDNDQISPWAIDAVGQMQASGIMDGTGDNNFSPASNFTREQSILTILRVFDLLD